MTHLATAALWVLLASTWAPGVQSGPEPCEPLEIFDSSGQPVNLKEICIGRYRTADCRLFVEKSFDEAYLPAGFPRSTYLMHWVPRPGDLVLKATNFTDNRLIYPGLQVEWTHIIGHRPDYNRRWEVAGFLLVWYNRRSPNKNCQLFQLDQLSRLIKDDLRFKFTIQKVEDNVTLVVQVFSLPIKAPKLPIGDELDYFGQTRIYHVPPTKYVAWFSIEPARWSPNIIFKTFVSGIIEIKFSHPPTHMRLFHYQIIVMDESDFTNPIYNKNYTIQENSNRPPEGVVTVQVTPRGCYTIMINVKEKPELEMKPGECGCWTLDLLDRKHCENVCGSSQARVCFNETFGGYKGHCVMSNSTDCECCYGFKLRIPHLPNAPMPSSVQCIPDGKTTVTKPDKCCRCDHVYCHPKRQTFSVCHKHRGLIFRNFRDMYFNACLEGEDLTFTDDKDFHVMFHSSTCYVLRQSLANSAFEVLSQGTTFIVIASILGVVLGISLLILMTLIVSKYFSRNKK